MRIESLQHEQDFVDGIIQSLGVNPSACRPTSMSFSVKKSPQNWKAYGYDTAFPLYKISAIGAKVLDLRNFIKGIQSNRFIILAELGDSIALCMNRARKGEQPSILLVRNQEDYERITNIFRKYNFVGDELMAWNAIDSSIDLLKSGAERYFVNRGLFSSYYLRERLDKALSDRKRNISKETQKFLPNIPSLQSTNSSAVSSVLSALGYDLVKTQEECVLKSHIGIINAAAIVVGFENFDVKPSGGGAVPSVQAVANLSKYPWVILTNGKIWRLYSSRVSSASTNYFEIDIEGITDEKDPRLKYFIALFSAAALVTKSDNASDLDYIFDGGQTYAKELEDNLRTKVFEKQLFLDLVKGVIGHSGSKAYSEGLLQDAKKNALQLLYRLLFVLYAESRLLLPINHPGYKDISLGSIRERLPALEKEPESSSVWNMLTNLFSSISKGNSNANLPQYNGALFEDKSLDSLEIKNKHLIPAMRALTEIDGRGIDYQNFGVRQLGSLYEALLEYSVRQAEKDMVMIKDEILDFSFASELRSRPTKIIEKGDLYLTAGAFARKGTGSYYTPEKIVKYLVHKGLEPIFEDREKKFIDALHAWRNNKTRALAEKCTSHLLDIQVLDPAMGSGHFLVAAVDEITRWIMSLLQKYTDTPLVKENEEDRIRILSEQKRHGITLIEELVSFNIILKRKVMKRCVFGVDINPLAVELAKLSLWLDSFTIGTPLTFLDHHIRCGDSLIGLWSKNFQATKSGNTTLDFWTGDIKSMGNAVHTISIPADLTVTDFKQNKQKYGEFREKSEWLRTVLDVLATDILNGNELTLSQKSKLIDEIILIKNLDKLEENKSIEKTTSYSNKYRFFHWELEFPDAYTDERTGFDLIIMNPPWDAVKPDDDDFFSQYETRFRKMRSKTEKKIVKEKLLKEPRIAKAFVEYCELIRDKISFFKNSNQYTKRGTGDIDMWKLFLERAITLTAEKGTLSILMPSGFLNNEGGKELRLFLLEKRIRYIYEFDNVKGIFPDIHSDYKFVILVADKVPPQPDFSTAFFLHDLKALDGETEQQKFLRLSTKFVKLVSPDTASIPELRHPIEIDIFQKLYTQNPLLSNGIENGNYTFKFVREMDRTHASHLFKTDGKGWPLIEGKHFHQFNPFYEKTDFTVRVEDGLNWTSKVREYGNLNKAFHNVPRLVFRSFGGSTNIRAIISCIIPKHSFVPNNTIVVVPRINNELVLNERYYKIIAYSAGIFNSYVFDFLVFRRVFMNLNFFLVYQTPIPSILDNELASKIIKLAARLSCVDERFEDLANATNVQCGPLGMKERLEITAELDAAVAHHYGLNRTEYEYIANTFEDFIEDDRIVNLGEINWNEVLIKKFNGEVRKRVLKHYDSIGKSGLKKKSESGTN